MPTADITILREIADGTRVDPRASVGLYCVIGPDVVIGPGTILGRRVTVTGSTIIGRDNLIGDGCVLGEAPQDLKFRGLATYLMIGDRNRLGPYVTAHVGTEPGGYLTRIGDDNVLDTGAHVAHDCYVEDRTRLGTGVLLSGHIPVLTGAVIEERAGIHHFTTIGRFSRVGARTPVRRDVPPFTVYSSVNYYDSPPAVRGVHEEGLASAGLDEADKTQVRKAIHHLFQDEKALSVKVADLTRAGGHGPAVRELLDFCRHGLAARYGRCRESLRGLIPPETYQYLPAEALASIEKAQRS